MTISNAYTVFAALSGVGLAALVAMILVTLFRNASGLARAFIAVVVVLPAVVGYVLLLELIRAALS